jgi:hypothetical protein
MKRTADSIASSFDFNSVRERREKQEDLLALLAMNVYAALMS